MTWATTLFGAQLLTKDASGKVESKPTDEVLKDKKFVVLYFSAHVSFAIPPRLTPRSGGRRRR